MKRTAAGALAACISALALAAEPATAPTLSAAQIVEKNAEARGGLDAWRKIKTMVWVGHVESPNAPAPSLPFVLQLKRPNKTRFEITALDQMAMRGYDGREGWKLHPARSSAPVVQPYTAEELKFARDEQVIDGPLMDYEAKGVAVALDGIDDVEGHQAYRLSVKLPSGAVRQVWIDAQNFLDVKYVRESRNALGQSGRVTVFYRNYQPVEGLQIPMTIESGAATTEATDRLVIERIAINPPLDDRVFGKPSTPGRRHAASIGADASQAVRGPSQLTPAPLPETR